MLAFKEINWGKKKEEEEKKKKEKHSDRKVK